MQHFGAEFGDLVRRRRGALGLTQEALAELAFGDPSRMTRISELENGRVARPQQRTVGALATALGLDDAEVVACRRTAAAAARPAAEPAARTDPAPAALQALARAFGVAAAGLDVDGLTARLAAAGDELRRLRAKVAGLDAAKARLTALADAAADAWRAGDPAAVDARLAEVEAAHQADRTLVEVRAQADIRQARAEAAFKASDVAAAADHLAAAAGYFAPFRPDLAADRRAAAVKRLHGLRDADPAAAPAAARLAALDLAAADRDADPERWARAKTWAGATAVALAAADPVDPAEADVAMAALNRAIEDICDALLVFTAADHARDWAWTQGHLGRALAGQARRADGSDRRRLAAMAAGACRNALRRDPADGAEIAAVLAAVEAEDMAGPDRAVA